MYVSLEVFKDMNNAGYKPLFILYNTIDFKSEMFPIENLIV